MTLGGSGGCPPEDGPGILLADFLNALVHELRGVLGTLAHQLEVSAIDGLDADLRARSRDALAADAHELDRLTTATAEYAALCRRADPGEFEPLAVTDMVPAMTGPDAEAGFVSRTVVGDRAVLSRGAGMLRDHVAANTRRDVTWQLTGATTAEGSAVVLALRDKDESTPPDPGRSRECPDRRAVTLGDGIEPFVAAQLVDAGGGTLTVVDGAERRTHYELLLLNADPARTSRGRSART